MISIKVDCHVHTLFSKHAFSTHRENAIEAGERGLRAVGIADHFGDNFIGYSDGAAGTPQKVFSLIGHLISTDALPEEWYGVRLLRSVEADIVDVKGNLFGHDVRIPFFGEAGTLLDTVLAKADYAIASVHEKPNSGSISIRQGTEMYCGALQNPKVKILGHIGRAGVPFALDEVLLAARDAGKIIEINEHSTHMGEEIITICRGIALRCAELGVWITVNSDAHSAAMVGRFPNVLAMLEEIGFPEALVANSSYERFLSVIG